MQGRGVKTVSNQLGLFAPGEVKTEKPETPVTVKLGSRSACILLKSQRRKAVKRLAEILKELEGKDIWIGSYDAGGRHYWLDNLKLQRLQVEGFSSFDSGLPEVIVLRGCRDACVRIFTDYLVAIREQEYFGYWLYLLDFRKGFWQSPIDNHKSHYACLHITRFKG